MISKLLYRCRRMVLVWQVNGLESRIDYMRGKELLCSSSKYYWLSKLVLKEQVDAINLQIVQLDATEMSKGDAHVVVR